MTRLLPVLAFVGAVSVTVGAGLIFPPLGFIVGGGFALAAGLLIEDGGA